MDLVSDRLGSKPTGSGLTYADDTGYLHINNDIRLTRQWQKALSVIILNIGGGAFPQDFNECLQP
jgi:hypothetical protein